MPEFDFKKCSRKCAVAERELGPGEAYFSALIESDEGVQRVDFSEEHWSGPPENCLGWWKSRIPDLEKGKIYWAPSSVMLAWFESVASDPKQSDVAYVMALLLVRKRILQWRDTIVRGETELMQLRRAAEKKFFEVATVDLSSERIQEIQTELEQQLFTDQPETDDNEPVRDEGETPGSNESMAGTE